MRAEKLEVQWRGAEEEMAPGLSTRVEPLSEALRRSTGQVWLVLLHPAFPMRANVGCPNHVHVRGEQVERVARVLAQLVVDRAAPSPYTAATPEFEAGAAFAEMARSKLGGELGSVGRSKGWERSPAPPDATATWLGEQGGVLDQNVKKRFFDLVRDRITMLRNRLAQSTLSMEQVCQGVCNVHCGKRCDCAGCFSLPQALLLVRRFPSGVPACRAEVVSILWARVPSLSGALPLALAALPLLKNTDKQFLAQHVPGCGELWATPVEVADDAGGDDAA